MNRKLMLIIIFTLIFCLVLCACNRNNVQMSDDPAGNHSLGGHESKGELPGNSEQGDENKEDDADSSSDISDDQNDSLGQDNVQDNSDENDNFDNMMDLGNGIQIGEDVEDWSDDSDISGGDNTGEGTENDPSGSGNSDTDESENSQTSDQTETSKPADNSETSLPSGETVDSEKDDNSALQYDPNDLLTYLEFISLSPSDQQAYFESFPSLDVYAAWYNYAKEQYDENQDYTEVEPGGSIDIGDFMN